MSWLTLLVIVLSCLASASSKKLPFDKVVPFAKDTNTTDIKIYLALKFKPQLYISSGCHPHPAVDADGNTNAGLGSFHVFKRCNKPSKGSQVYGRVLEVDGKWGFMFAWYFPRDSMASRYNFSHRHAWANVVLWLSSLSHDAKLLSVTIKSFSDYSKHSPEADEMDGNHVKLKYTTSWLHLGHHLELTHKDGQYQALIMWDDMTDAARKALDTTDFYDSKTPFNDVNFENNIDEAYPFDKNDEA